MLIYPGIDIYCGNVVGLYRGNFDDLKVYHSDPMEVVNDLVNQKTTHIHLVDLDSARTGKLNLDMVKQIKDETGLFIEVGGSIRNMPSVEKFLDAGADRVVIGSAALNNEAFIKEALGTYKDKIVVSIDIKGGLISIHGRTEKNAPKALDFARRMEDYGAKTIICSDVSKAGNMAGIDYDLFDMMNQQLSADIIASGGVSSLEDILDLQSMNMYGVIVGRAYYDGAISVREAIRIAV